MTNDETDTREYEDLPPDARVEFQAAGGVFVFTLHPGTDQPAVVCRLDYADCEWMLTAYAAAKKGQDFERVLARDCVARGNPGRILFASAIAREGGFGIEVAAPFGIEGWSLITDWNGERGKQMLAAIKLAMKQEDAKP
jgi:hypothetical protein